MTSPPVILESPTKGVRRLILNRPSRLNAMTVELVQGLHDALDEIAVDRSCRVWPFPRQPDTWLCGLKATAGVA